MPRLGTVTLGFFLVGAVVVGIMAGSLFSSSRGGLLRSQVSDAQAATSGPTSIWSPPADGVPLGPTSVWSPPTIGPETAAPTGAMTAPAPATTAAATVAPAPETVLPPTTFLPPTVSLTATTAPAPGGATCGAEFRVGTITGSDFDATVTVTNTGTTAISAWRVDLVFANREIMTQVRGGSWTSTDGAQQFVLNDPSNGSLTPGQSVVFDLLAAGQPLPLASLGCQPQ